MMVKKKRIKVFYLAVIVQYILEFVKSTNAATSQDQEKYRKLLFWTAVRLVFRFNGRPCCLGTKTVCGCRVMTVNAFYWIVFHNVKKLIRLLFFFLFQQVS